MANEEVENPENCSDSESDFNELQEWLNNVELHPTRQVVSCLSSAFLSLLKRTLSKVDRLIEQHKYRKISREYESLETLALAVSPVHYEQYFNPYFRDRMDFMPQANNDSIAIRQRKLADMLAMRSKTWTPEEFSLLKDCVKSWLKKAMTDRLSDDCALLKDMLSEVQPTSGQKSAAEDLLSRLVEANNDRKKIENDGQMFDIALANPKSIDLIDWDSIATHHQFAQRSTSLKSAIDCLYAWAGACAPWINQDSWSTEELDHLKILSRKYNNHHWDAIARELGTGRTAYHCAQSVLSQKEASDEAKSKWTIARDALLLERVESNVDDEVSWKNVTHSVGAPNVRKCVRRYGSLKARHGKWSAEEDDRLLKAVAEYGNNCWTQIAAAVHTRTDTQCRNRYVYCLSVNSKEGAWSRLEDELLMLGVQVFGKQWMKIRFLLPRRGAHKAQNHYRFLQRRRGRTSDDNNGTMRQRKLPVDSVKYDDVPKLSELPDELLSILTPDQRRKLDTGLMEVRMKFRAV
uniref:snRNA-activating protein complex subunit 4 n=1 Tax=Trichuris muris TaxID=70415 RepID=A0A5S6QYD1_TRIMR